MRSWGVYVCTCIHVSVYVMWYVYVYSVSGGNDLVSLLSTKASRFRYLASLPEMSQLVPKPLPPQTWLCWLFVALV